MSRTTLVGVPKAPMNEHGPAMSSIGNVWFARQIGVANPESVPKAMKRATHFQFRLGTLPPLALHAPASSFVGRCRG